MGEKPSGSRWGLLRRFIVADRSMEPTLVAGQGLVALRSRRARVGQIRVFPHPDVGGFWLVKRVAAVHEAATMTVLSDNAAANAVDSRVFGPVPIVGSYRVVVRVPLRLMR